MAVGLSDAPPNSPYNRLGCSDEYFGWSCIVSGQVHGTDQKNINRIKYGHQNCSRSGTTSVVSHSKLFIIWSPSVLNLKR